MCTKMPRVRRIQAAFSRCAATVLKNTTLSHQRDVFPPIIRRVHEPIFPFPFFVISESTVILCLQHFQCCFALYIPILGGVPDDRPSDPPAPWLPMLRLIGKNGKLDVFPVIEIVFLDSPIFLRRIFFAVHIIIVAYYTKILFTANNHIYMYIYNYLMCHHHQVPDTKT